MNQILYLKQIKKYKIIFIAQLIISFIGIIIIFIKLFNSNFQKYDIKSINKAYKQNSNLSKIYDEQQDENIYLGKLYIEKINLEYMIFNKYSDDLLKLSICKFYGENLDSRGNICLVGHNYENNEFFSNLHKLEIGDRIVIEDISGNIYSYKIFSKYETTEDDLSILDSKYEHELTLLTCNNFNKKRLIVKSKKI